MFGNIANFSNTNDYIPLFNGVMITDLFVILLLNMGIIKSRVLRGWYDKYNLSAVMADVLIIMIGLIIARYIYYSSVPRGMNQMIDTFKDYAKDVSYKAVLSDSGMMVMAAFIGSYLANQSANTNMIVMIVSLYFLPYFIYN